MDDVIALRRLVRAHFYNPDTFEKRLKELNTVWERQFVDGREDLEPFLDMLEEETGKFLAHQDDKAQRPDGPTRQTAEKLGKDPVLILLANGRLDNFDKKTIQELLELRQKLSAGLTTGGMDLKGERVDTSTKTFTHPIERLTKRQDLMLTHVYRPWVDAHQYSATQVGESRFLCLSPFQLTISVIEMGIPLGHFEAKFRVRNGSLSKPLVDTIRDFGARLAAAEHEGKVPRREK